MPREPSRPKSPKPSGSYWREQAKRKKEAERKRRQETGEITPKPAPDLKDKTQVHLSMVEVLWERVRFTSTDPALEETERTKILAELGRAIGMLQTKSDLERRLRDLEADIDRKQDELVQARAEVERERRELAEERRRLSMPAT